MAGGDFKRSAVDDLVPQLLDYQKGLHDNVSALTTSVAVLVSKVDTVNTNICRNSKESKGINKRVTTLERRSYIGAGMWATTSTAIGLFFYNYGHKLLALLTKGSIPDA